MTPGVVVAITDTKDRPVAVDVVHSVLGSAVDLREVDFPDGQLPAKRLAEIVDQLRNAAAVFMRTGRLSGTTIAAIPDLQIVALHGAGVDQVDVTAASARGVYVTNAPGGNSEAVAEYVFGLLLGLVRQIFRADRLVRQDKWTEAIVHGQLLEDKVLGVIGFGHIGRRVARIAGGFGMSVVAYDPYVKPRVLREAGVVPVSLDHLLQLADFVTLHLPISDDTRNLIDRRRLQLMKPSAVLINTARGGLVDETALVELLGSERLAGAALDTFEHEPLPASSPLLQLEHVLLSPHMAGVAREVLAPIAEMAALDIKRVLDGERPLHWVNAEGFMAAG